MYEVKQRNKNVVTNKKLKWGLGCLVGTVIVFFYYSIFRPEYVSWAAIGVFLNIVLFSWQLKTYYEQGGEPERLENAEE